MKSTLQRLAWIILMSKKNIPKLDLSSVTLLVPQVPRERSCTPSPSPFPSPPSTPLSTAPSGHLEVAKYSLDNTIKKRGTKASSTSIDACVTILVLEYLELTTNEKYEFLSYLARNISTNHSKIVDLAKNLPVNEFTGNEYEESVNLEAIIRWEDKLRVSLQPPYHWLATQISRLPGGVKFIIDLRADVVNFLAAQTADRKVQSELKAVDIQLRELLSLWFTVGMLNLLRITWASPCEILQKISEYEAVHPVRNWTDLKKRVGNYRRCFVFTHSCIPDEPLVVLHTYLTHEISESMSKIVQVRRSMSVCDEASLKAGENSSLITTAIFYSITSTQKGLKGIELGNYLIKRVVKELQAELPNLKNFSSLSPVPGFMKWLQNNVQRAQKGKLDLFTPTELQELKKIFCMEERKDIYAEFRRLLLANGWVRDDQLQVFCELPMMRLCAYYLYMEKWRGYACDPVANFHLKNGAVMWRLNWNADRTPRGLDNSCGIMVNYRYFIDDCEKNTKNYVEDLHISASENIIYLAKNADSLLKKSSSQNP